MSSLKLYGSTSGYVEIVPEVTAGNNSVTLPNTTGSIAVKDASGNLEVGTGVTVSSPSSNTFAVSTNGSERIRIGSSGNIGIATTNPQYNLDVLGDINFTGTFRQNGSVFVASRWTAGIGDDIYRLSGDVGIGTTNPQYSLDVLGDINFTGTFRQNGSAFVASRWTAGTGDDIYRLNGDVGIGTTNPTAKLQVVGDATISGIVTATTLSKTTLSDYADKINALGNTGTAATINLANGNFVTATLTGNCQFTFTTGIGTGAQSFTLFLTNDATPSRTITWPLSVKWPGGSVPVRTETANKTDVYSFFTFDNGTNWYGTLSIYNYS